MTVNEALDSGLYDALWDAATATDRRHCRCNGDLCALCEDASWAIEATLSGESRPFYVQKTTWQRLSHALETCLMIVGVE